MARISTADKVYEVANLFRQRCLQDGTSLLWPEQRVWSPETVSQHLDAFLKNEDTSDRSFLAKWHDQLSTCSDQVHQVAADVLAFYHLFPSNVGEKHKLADVGAVISWRFSGIAPDLSFLREAYKQWVGGTGQYYLIGKPYQIGFYLEFSRRVLEAGPMSLSPESCKLLTDEAAKAIPMDCSAARNILLHLLFPDSFERIASNSHKRQIVKAFRHLSGDAADTDDALLTIRQELLAQYEDDHLDFYWKSIRSIWDAPSTPASPWDEFIAWARKFWEDPQFDQHERVYKLEIAARLAEARRAFRSRDPQWQTLLRRAFAPVNAQHEAPLSIRVSTC
jgi:5-methylcytosine-specific restriction enzyme B